MGNIIAPPNVSRKKEVTAKASKSFLSDALATKTRQLVDTKYGAITAAQAMAERLVNIAIFAESNADAISAQKLIYDRLQGKAAVVKDDETRPMPKVVFSLTEEGLDKVNSSRNVDVSQFADVEDDGSGLVEIKIDDKTYVG